MSDIFISYANEDGEFAHRLADVFAKHGWDVWWDKHIPPGMDYAQVIEKAIDEARCVVVLWSRHSVDSRWVRTEAAAGADRNVVATVIIDQTPNEAIPFEFRRLQAVNLSDWRPGRPHAGFGMLADRVRSMLDEPFEPADDSRPAPRRSGWWEALTDWGRGRQTVYRGAGTLSGLAMMVGASRAYDTTDPLSYGVAFGLLGLGVVLFGLGRRAA